MYADADTHVDECEETWAYVPDSAKDLLPRTLEFAPDEIPSWLSANRSSGSGYYRFWFINGELYPRRVRSDERTGTTLGTRELGDVAARLRDMDRLGVEVQVLYPTVFLDEISRLPEVQTALHHSYNRWISERCEESGGRLRWIAMIPFADPLGALEEVRWAKEHGAVGIFKLGYECERPAGDPYFYPVYQAAAERELAVSIHQGSGWNATPTLLTRRPIAGASGPVWPVVESFASMLGAKIHEKVPGLKVAFVEAGAAWLPYVLGLAGWSAQEGWRNSGPGLAELGFWITCETFEDLPYLLQVAGGDDNFVVGSDYTHGDRSSVIDAHKKIVERKDIDPKSATKITSDNVRALYGL